jgi:hypothetical protein
MNFIQDYVSMNLIIIIFAINEVFSAKVLFTSLALRPNFINKFSKTYK